MKSSLALEVCIKRIAIIATNQTVLKIPQNGENMELKVSGKLESVHPTDVGQC